MTEAKENLDKSKTVMVSGHTDLSKEEFDTYYVPELKASIAKGESFVVGGADGCDKMTQEFLSNYPEVNATIYDKGTQKNVHCSRFGHINGFASYPLRDKAMTEASYRDIAYLHQYGGAASGTGANLLRRKFGHEMAEQITKLLRDHSMKYDKTAKEKLKA